MTGLRKHLKRFVLSAVAATLCLAAVNRAPAQDLEPDDTPTKNEVAPKKDANPTARMVNVRMEHNVVVQERKGMRFHLKLQVDNGKGVPMETRIYFYSKSGKPLKGLESDFSDGEGSMCTFVKWTPRFDKADANGTLFMPYNAITPEGQKPGTYTVKFAVNVWCEDVNRYIVAKPHLGEFVLTIGDTKKDNDGGLDD